MFAINSHSTWVLLQRDICACWQPIRLICICEKAWILRRKWLRVWPIPFILGMDLTPSWFHLKPVWMEGERGEKQVEIQVSSVTSLEHRGQTESTRLGFTGMDYPAGLTFSQVGSPVQITLPLSSCLISPGVREDNNTALISPISWKSLCHCYLQLRD